MDDESGKKTFSGVSDENLSIEVTTECNSRCSHCFARAGLDSRTSMDCETVQDIIDEGYEAGYRNLHITGGEPLLWKKLVNALDYAKERGYEKIFLNTNGTLLDRSWSRRLAAYTGLTASVSIHGPKGLHDRVRGSGAYDRAIRGVQRGLDAGLPVVLFTVVSRSLIPHLPHFTDEMYKTIPGIEFLTLIQLIRVYGDAFDLSDELLGPEDFISMVKMAALLNLYGLRIDVLENPLAIVAARKMGMPWLPQAPELHRRGRIIILADGNITLSHSSRESFGRYTKGMLKRVLDSEGYQRRVSPDMVTCPACRFIDLCREWGMTRPSGLFRDMNEAEPYCRRVLELLID